MTATPWEERKERLKHILESKADWKRNQELMECQRKVDMVTEILNRAEKQFDLKLSQPDAELDSSDLSITFERSNHCNDEFTELVSLIFCDSINFDKCRTSLRVQVASKSFGDDAVIAKLINEWVSSFGNNGIRVDISSDVITTGEFKGGRIRMIKEVYETRKYIRFTFSLMPEPNE